MVKVWKIAPGRHAREWEPCHERRCIAIGWLNQTNFYQFKNEDALIKALKKAREGKEGATHSIWKFVHKVQQREIVVANEGRNRVVGIGVVESDYLPPENPHNPNRSEEDYRHTRLVDWQIDKPIDLPENFFAVQTVQLLNSEQCDKIKRAYLKQYPELKKALDELFPPPKPPVVTTMITLLEQFKQIIAYGPPGTGKTREAKRVALALLSGKEPAATASEKDIETNLKKYREQHRFDLVVFHPAYEYEQFVGGIEPKETQGQVTFHTEPGVFLRLCRKAKQNQEPCVLIIDEINRGNLPKLLGELVYALEYRGHEVSLPFTCDGHDKLIVPKNLYVIATMNSADRSIGHIDVAIRRRFALFPAGPSPAVVRDVWGKIGDESYGHQLADLMQKLNAMINKGNPSTDSELGVGHSYFIPTLSSVEDAQEQSVEDAKEQVELKWTYQVQPLLREYVQLMNLGADSLQRYCKEPLESVLTPL
ncbi:MAG TPA: AAA family ATPase [Gemmataceae bacterium]|jgi:5-methylcytosine-specific restriction protein B